MKKDLSIEEKINKKSETWGDKINFFFNNIKFINLSIEKKEQVALKVKSDIVTWKLYWIEIFLSSVIAALWLIQNSIAVVIWAMLIAPLLRPINWVSYSISKGERKIFILSLKTLVLSIIISVLMWYLSAKIVWLSHETSEILSRISPNILDLFIAIFSAMIAVLSLWYSRLTESVVWVAMAASLMPPLAVVWIEIALLNYSSAYWAFMLFLANLVAIILVWIIIFWLYWYTPNKTELQKSSVETFLFIVIIMLVISVPLVQSLIKIKDNVVIKNISINYLENILKKENSQISISNLDVEQNHKDKIIINSTIKLPEWIDFYDTFKKQLDFELTKKLWKDVELNIDFIRTANIISSINSSNVRDKIYDLVAIEFKEKYKKYSIISLEVNKNNWIYYVKIILWVDWQNFEGQNFEILENIVKTAINEKIEFNYIPLSIYKEKISEEISLEEKSKIELEKEFRYYIDEKATSWIILKNLTVDYDKNNKVKIEATFEVNEWNIDFPSLIQEIKSFSASKNIDIEIKFYNYTDIKITNEE